MPLFLLLAAAGLFFLSSKKQPTAAAPRALPSARAKASPGITPAPVVPATVLKAISDAIASLDPDVIKTLAAALDKQGFSQQAADLRVFSAGMMNAMKKA